MSAATSAANLSAAQEQENARINAENERLRRKATTRRRVGLGFSYFALILITVLMIFPLVIVVLVSFTPNEVTQTWPPKIIPSAWTLSNYTDLFSRLPIGREMLNTVVFAGAVTVISVFFDSLAAYGLSRVDFKGRGLLLGVLIATMMIPGMALLIPVYKLLANMGLVNSYLGIIIPRMADVGGIFLLRQFFISIPKDLDNAARIDGAGEFRIFAQIILPNAVPAILTVGMFNFMGNWNDLLRAAAPPAARHSFFTCNSARSRRIEGTVTCANLGRSFPSVPRVSPVSPPPCPACAARAGTRPSMRSHSRSTAIRTASRRFGSTELNAGYRYWESTESSYPNTFTSCGTRMPCRRSSCNAPAASRSLMQTIPSGRSPCSIMLRTAISPVG